MNRRLLWLLLLFLLAVGTLAQAQQQAKVAKIGWLTSSSATGNRALWQALGELGYVEGKNIIIEYGHADNKLDRLPALADELVRLKVDVLIVGSTPAALAAKKATGTIPIVFYNVSDPVAAGWLIAWPGQGRTSRGSPPSWRSRPANDWSCLRKPFPNFPARRCCGIRRFPAPHNNGKKANWRDVTWVCNFIPWRQAAPANTTVRSKSQLRRVVPLSL